MKHYTIVIEHRGQNISEYVVVAKNMKEAAKIGGFTKRMEKKKGKLIVIG